MKVIPPSNERERNAWKRRIARKLTAANGERWRVDAYAGRYGWVVRAVRLPPKGKKEPGQENSPALGSAVTPRLQS